MSDGHDKVAGLDTTIELNGKEYACPRIRFKHMAEASRHVLESRKDVMDFPGADVLHTLDHRE